MALAVAAARRSLWGLRTGTAAGIGTRGGLRGPSRGGSGGSGRAGSKALVSVLGSALKRLNGSYLRFLARNFPRVHRLQNTLSRGFQTLLLEFREIRRIRWKMAQEKLSKEQLPYREMERLRQFRRDVLKALPIGILAIPPFANFLVLLLMYLFPRQLLIRHFWSPSQHQEFLELSDRTRRGSYPLVVQSLALVAPALQDPELQQLLEQLCTKVQRGAHPPPSELVALRTLFSGSPLGLQELRGPHLKALSQILFLTTHLPTFFLRLRLRNHLLEIQHLDLALLHLGLGQLSEEELRGACYLRGLNSTHLDPASCRDWLEQWLGLSCKLKASEASLLANSMVLLSLNYSRSRE